MQLNQSLVETLKSPVKGLQTALCTLVVPSELLPELCVMFLQPHFSFSNYVWCAIRMEGNLTAYLICTCSLPLNNLIRM